MGREIRNCARDDEKGKCGFRRALPRIISFDRKRPPPFKSTITGVL